MRHYTTLRLPWPPKALHAHAKGCWYPKAEATRRYRRAAYYLAREARVQRDERAILTFTYHPPDRRRRDVANVHHAMKPLIDGIADAMGCDDNGFRPRFPDSFAEPVKGGAVIVTISEAP